MKVFVVLKTEHYAFDETISTKIGTTVITMTDLMYRQFTTILGVYASTDAARKALKNKKMELIQKYGEKVLDDEDIEDMHTFYTFTSVMLELNDDDEKEGDKK